MLSKARLRPYVGWTAFTLACLAFTSLVDQMRINLQGNPGSVFFALILCFNCSAWVAYSMMGEKIDWPMFGCNFLGALMGIATTLTVLYPQECNVLIGYVADLGQSLTPILRELADNVCLPKG